MADDEQYPIRRGYWLRVARERKINEQTGRSWTLEDLARAMDYSTKSASTFSRFESGERDPSDVMLRRLAAVLGVPVEVFNDPDETAEERLAAKIRRVMLERDRRRRQAG
jgi:transcriptional regulator with XRE-family HTH domain